MNNTLILNPPFSIFRYLILKRLLSFKIFRTLGLISITLLSVFYIFQINAMMNEIYLTHNYQRKLKNLSQENKTLEISFSQESSLSNIEALIKNLNFEKVNQIHYIQVLESQVVTK